MMTSPAKPETPEKPYDEAESIATIWVTDVDDRALLQAMISGYGNRRAEEMRERAALDTMTSFTAGHRGFNEQAAASIRALPLSPADEGRSG